MPKEPVTYNLEGKIYFALPLPTEQLPQILPPVQSYQPSGNGESPLAGATGWFHVYFNILTGETISANGGIPAGDEWVHGHRETNTMPQWAGSCWYYLRYCDPINKSSFVSPELEKYWGAPDLYVGGAEHAVLHLLYARFWHRVLFKLGFISNPEPFPRVIHQGLILGEPEHRKFKDAKGNLTSAEFVDKEGIDLRTGQILEAIKASEDEVLKKGDFFVLKQNPEIRVESRAFKMSKSRGNVVSPDAIIRQYGADSLRLYEMFLGPLEAMKPWNTKGIEGVVRFLKRIWREYIDEDGNVSFKILDSAYELPETERILQETIKKVTEDIENLRFNTAISQMMIFLNHLAKAETVTMTTARTFIQLLAPFAPHLGEELWARLGGTSSIVDAPWPKYDPTKLLQNEVTLVVQINGKVRGELPVAPDISKEEAFALAKAHARVSPYFEGKVILKEIYVPGKIINFVLK